MHRAGVLFSDSSDKAARFIWICNAFNIPLLFLSDISGYMIGSAVEREGIIRHGAKMLYAVCESTVPRIDVLVRKAYGGGYLAMSGSPTHPDAVLALPTAKPALMGPAAAVNAIHFNRVMAIEDSGRAGPLRRGGAGQGRGRDRRLRAGQRQRLRGRRGRRRAARRVDPAFPDLPPGGRRRAARRNGVVPT